MADFTNVFSNNINFVFDDEHNLSDVNLLLLLLSMMELFSFDFFIEHAEKMVMWN